MPDPPSLCSRTRSVVCSIRRGDPKCRPSWPPSTLALAISAVPPSSSLLTRIRTRCHCRPTRQQCRLSSLVASATSPHHPPPCHRDPVELAHRWQPTSGLRG